MNRIRMIEIAAAAAMLTLSSVRPVAAQSERPAITVMGFESGTVSAQIQDRQGFMSILSAMPGTRREQYDPSQLGVGVADMLIEKLLETGEFKLVERKQDGDRNGARYVVTGSITKFGFEERNFGGAFANVATLGLLSYKQHKTEVKLTARIIDETTGEIVASVSGEGASGKGGGLRVGGIGGGGAGGVDVNSSNFRSTAIGQATERAVRDLAQKIAAKRPVFGVVLQHGQ
jgi:curli biogenesis system outer membrane secretion channel CsgG